MRKIAFPGNSYLAITNAKKTPRPADISVVAMATKSVLTNTEASNPDILSTYPNAGSGIF